METGIHFEHMLVATLASPSPATRRSRVRVQPDQSVTSLTTPNRHSGDMQDKWSVLRRVQPVYTHYSALQG